MTKNLQLSGRALSSWLKVIQFHSRCHFSAQLPQHLKMKPLALQKITATEHCTATLATQVTRRLSYWSSSFYTASHQNPQPLQPAPVTPRKPPLTADRGSQVTAGFFHHSTILHSKHTDFLKGSLKFLTG